MRDGGRHSISPTSRSTSAWPPPHPTRTPAVHPLLDSSRCTRTKGAGCGALSTQGAGGWLAALLSALERPNTSLLQSHLREDGSKISAPAVPKGRKRKDRAAPDVSVASRSPGSGQARPCSGPDCRDPPHVASAPGSPSYPPVSHRPAV